MGNDNGILDIETINNELMEQRNINTKPESSEVLNTETSMNSGTMNPLVSAPTAIEPVNPVVPAPVAVEPVNPVMPEPSAIEPINSVMPEPSAIEPANPAMSEPSAIEPVIPTMPAPAAMEPTNPVMPDFSDLEIQDNFQNFDPAIMPEAIDSRSFTHTAAEWKRIQEEEKDNYVEPVDAWDNYIENKPQNFFQSLFAFLVSFIIAGVGVLINVKFYNIEYISTLQCLLVMLPAMGLFYGFYNMTGKRKMTVVTGVILIIVNEFISYFMFHAVMVHGVREMYAGLSYREARDVIKIMRMVSETRELYYTHFAAIFGVGSLAGIIFGWYGIRGMLDARARRGRRY